MEDQMASIWQAFQDELGHKFKWISTATIKWENPDREREREREEREYDSTLKSARRSKV